MKFSLAKDTRTGARRINQDRLGHWQSDGALLLAVADGLGGHARGEVAAQLAIETFGEEFARGAQPRVADPQAFLGTAVHAAHAAILLEGQRMRLHETPRTVIVACLVQDGTAWWINVGDARLYFIRDSRIVHRTKDHTVVQQLIDSGRIREEAAAAHPERNRLLQCLGGTLAPKPPQASREALAERDTVLLCSDGFWGPLPQREVLHGLATRPLEQAITELSAMAERRAGAQCDNVTVLAMTWAA